MSWQAYFRIFVEHTSGTYRWVVSLITFEVPWYENYFWGLIGISLTVWGLEVLFPWRSAQGVVRKDFWLDGFYMFFNFFLFSIAIYGFYGVVEAFCLNLGLGVGDLALVEAGKWPQWVQLLVFFVSLDFVQWLTHILLHRLPVFWRFHQVHHSVKEMGFAAHLRYHWMENILYKPLKTLVVMILGGFEPEAAYLMHFFSIVIGHLNHANLAWTYGPLKYVFNNPVMHLWHHKKQLPENRQYGVNYGISLSVWDYLFGTSYVPEVDGEMELGFAGDEQLPKGFLGQLRHGFKK